MHETVITFSDFELNVPRCELRREGRVVPVQPKVFDLVLYLVRHRGRVVPRSELLDRLWPDVSVSEEALSRAVYAARKILGDDGANQRLIQTVRGRGLRFAGPVVSPDVPVPRELGSTGSATLSYPVQLPFVGRQEVLDDFLGVIARVGEGHGCFFFVTGEPGIGKSRTAEELCQLASRRGARVLKGWCEEGNGAPPFWPWVQVLRAAANETDLHSLERQLGAGAPDIAGLVPAIRQRLQAIGDAPPLQPQQARFRLFDSVSTFLRNAAESAVHVVAFDDLHRADLSSLSLLEFLSRELRSTKLLVLATFRGGEVDADHPLTGVLAEIGRHAPCLRVGLRGLTRADVMRLLGCTLDHPTPAPFAAAVHEKTEGNPLFVTEFVRLLLTGRGPHPPTAESRWMFEVPPSLKEAFSRRFGKLSDTTLRVLRSAALLGREFRLRELRAVTGLEPTPLLVALAPAQATCIVDEEPDRRGHFRFRHVLIRDALCEELLPLERAERHLEVARALAALHGPVRGPHVAALAHHFSEAALVAGAGQALHYTVEAAEWARERLAYEEAVGHYRRALEIHEQEFPAELEPRCDLLLELGDAEIRAGERTVAKATFERAGELARQIGSAERLARSALSYAPGLLAIETGIVDPVVVRLLEEALEATPSGDARTRALLMARLAVELQWSGDKERQLALSREALALGEGLGDRSVLAFVLSARHTALWNPDSLDERLKLAGEVTDIACEAGDPETSLLFRVFRLTALLEKGEAAAAWAEVTAFRAEAEELRQPQFLWWTVLFRSLRALHDGRLAEAEHLVPEFARAWHRLRDENAFQCFVFHLSAVRRVQDRTVEILRLVEETVARYPRVPGWRALLAGYAIDADRHQVARLHFEHFASNDFENLTRDMNWQCCMASLVDACVGLGDARSAELLYDSWLPYADRHVVAGFAVAWLGPVSRHLGRLATLLGAWDDADRHFAEALRQSVRTGACLWVAHTEFDSASMLLARGDSADRPRAEELLRDALSLARKVGFSLLERRIQTLANASVLLRIS